MVSDENNADAMSKPLHILLLEDRLDDAELIAHELRHAGFDPRIERVDEEDEFRAGLDPEVDLILADHALPQFDALRALAEVQERQLDVPFILVSGTISEKKAVRAMREGATDFVFKDRLGRLGPAVRRALKEHQLRKEKQQAVRELRESNARFQALAANMPGVIYQLQLRSDDGISFPYVSPGAQEIFGAEPAAIMEDASLLIDLIHPEDYPAVEASLRRSAETHAPWRWEGRMVIQGNVMWLKGVARPRTQADGSILWDGLLVDITDRKRDEQNLIEAKEKAEEMNRLKSTFLANMSHEIRTPLTSILGFSELLANQVEGQQFELVQLIRMGGNRLMETLTSVLDLAQLESGTKHLTPESFDLVSETRKILEMFDLRARRRRLELTYSGPDEPAFATLDRNAYGRILSNLLSNAVKFTREGRIDVTLEVDDTHVTLVVADTGVGIDEDFVPHVFDEFKQESAGLARDYEGTGLGLTITKRLVDMMGGEVDLESTKGEGSVFTVRLPQMPADEET